MSKKRPCIIQIDRDTHKKLKIMSAWQNRSMGGIVIELVNESYEKRVKHSAKKLYLSLKNIGEGVCQNDEI